MPFPPDKFPLLHSFLEACLRFLIRYWEFRYRGVVCKKNEYADIKTFVSGFSEAHKCFSPHFITQLVASEV